MHRLLQASIEAGVVGDVREQLLQLIAATKEEPGFFDLLKSPGMNLETRQQWIEDTFSSTIDNVLVEFLKYLASIEGLHLLGAVADLYEQAIVTAINEEFQLIEGTLTAAIMPTAEQVARLQEAFSKKLNKTVKLETVVDPDMVAGYRVELDGHIYDASIETNVKQLRDTLNQVKLFE